MPVFVAEDVSGVPVIRFCHRGTEKYKNETACIVDIPPEVETQL
ncbi:hypothetical protein ACI6Q2_04485 [Chitinophagaceae bacterium LWZ2-11]